MKFEIAELSKQDFDSWRDIRVASSSHSNVNSLNELFLTIKIKFHLRNFEILNVINVTNFIFIAYFYKASELISW